MATKQMSARALLKEFAATFASRGRQLDDNTVRILAPFAEDVARKCGQALFRKCLPTAEAVVSIVTGQDTASFEDVLTNISMDDVINDIKTPHASLVFMDLRANVGNPSGHAMCYYVDKEFDVVVRIHSQGDGNSPPCFAFYEVVQSVETFATYLGVPMTVDDFIDNVSFMVRRIDDCIPITDTFTLRKVAAKGSRIKVLPVN